MKKKKILSIIIAFVMTLGLMPARAFADEAYDLRVGGVEVTSSNLSGEGWVFDPENSKLTLTDAVITGSLAQYSSVHGIISERDYLILELNGNNTVTAADAEHFSCGVYSEGNLTIMGAGSLTVSAGGGEDSHGIYGADDIIIEGGNIIASGGEADVNSYGIFAAGYLTVNNGTVTATGQTGAFNTAPNINNYENPVLTVNGSPSASGALPWDNTTELTNYKYVRIEPYVTGYNVWVGGVQVTPSNKDDIPGVVSGKASYNPDIKTLTLDNVFVKDYYNFGSPLMSVIYSKDDLTIELVGDNTLKNKSCGDRIVGISAGVKTNLKNLTIKGDGRLNMIMTSSRVTANAFFCNTLRQQSGRVKISVKRSPATTTWAFPVEFNNLEITGGVLEVSSSGSVAENKIKSITMPSDYIIYGSSYKDGTDAVVIEKTELTGENHENYKYVKFKPTVSDPFPIIASGGKAYSDLACTNEINEAQEDSIIYFKCDRPPEGKWVHGLSFSPDSVNYIDYYKAYPNIIYSIKMPDEELTIEPYVYDQYEDIVDLRKEGSAKNVSYDAVFSEEYWDSEHLFGPKDLDGDGHYDIIIEEDSGSSGDGPIIWVEYSDSETLEPVSHDYHVRIYQHQDSNLAGQVKVFTYGPDRPYKKITYIFGTPITAFNYTVTEPRVGEKPSGTMTMTTTPSKALVIGEITINNISWFESDTGIIESWRLWYGPEGDWRLMEAEETFKEGKYYYPYTYTGFDDSILESGYFWGDPIKYYINGRETEDLVFGPLSATPPLSFTTHPASGEAKTNEKYNFSWVLSEKPNIVVLEYWSKSDNRWVQYIDLSGNSAFGSGSVSIWNNILDGNVSKYRIRAEKGSETVYSNPFTVTWIANTGKKGDVNNDKAVNSIDKAILNRYLAGWEGYNTMILNWDAADINNDGFVDARDKAILNRYLAGWEGYDSYFES